MTAQRLRQRDERGAMLIIAMVIVTTVALVTGALLTQGWGNFRATVELRGVAGTSYAADTGAKVAVNHLRLGADAPGWTVPGFPGLWGDWVFTNNADGTGCFGAVGTSPDNVLELSNLYPATGTQTAPSSVRVTCDVVPGTGIFGAGSGVGIEDPDPTDAYARALTTIGTAGAWQGMTLKPLGTGNEAPMPMRGGISSKSFIDVDNGALVTDGAVKAEGPCSGQIISNPAAACIQPGSVPVPDAPPSPLTSVPAYQNPAGAIGCVFQPGFYNDAAALSASVNACGTARFASGAYYFDFNDETRGGQNVWRINTTVIGGEYVSGVVPGACRSPIVHDPTPGVQFVFGGTSRMEVDNAAHVELCGASNGGEPALTLFQQQTGSSGTPVVGPAQPAQVVEQVTGAKIDNFTVVGGGTLQGALAAPGGSSLSWVSSKKNQEAALDLRDFPGLAAIPVGADITSAEVRIRYTKSIDAPQLQLDVTGTPTNAAVPVPAADGTGWAGVDVSAHLRALVASGPFDASRPRLELRLPSTEKDRTLTVDAITLAVTYAPPSLRAAQDVAFIRSGANFKGEFVVQGATFVPDGYVDLDPGNNLSALVAFRWGLVALGVNFKAQPAQEFGYPLVSIPDAGTGLGNRVTVVDLRIHVCVEQASCATGGTHALTSRVMIVDPPYSSWGGGPARPEPGRRRVEILSWSHRR